MFSNSDHAMDALDEELNRSEDEFYDAFAYSTPKKVSCKFCHKGGFTWITINGKYMMAAGDGSIHTCLKDAAQAKKQKSAAVKALSSVLEGKPKQLSEKIELDFNEINYQLKLAALDFKMNKFMYFGD